MDFPGMRDFLARYQAQGQTGECRSARLLSAAVRLCDRTDPGAGGDRHREPRSQGPGQVTSASTRSRPIVGSIRYGPTGEWANPRIVYVQFQGIADKNLEQFRSAGKQVIVAPDAFKTGEVKPFSQARN